MNSGTLAPSSVRTPEPVVQAGKPEKGGSLTDLFKKLEEGSAK